MRTENHNKRGLIFIMLVSAIVLSITILITFIATPVLTGGIENEPGGTTIEVGPGQGFTFVSSSAYQEDNLASYWKFDEGSENIAYDNSGYGNHGTIYGATWTVGKIGGALYFDGDDYVLVPSSPSLEITDELTLEAWIKVQYSTDLEILRKTYRFSEVGYGLHFWDPERMVTFHVGATIYGGIGTREIFLELDEWYHIAGTYIKSTGEWKIYVNGVLENSLTRPGQLAADNAPIRIGGISPSSFFRGVIDEIRIYNRALSPDEILRHYLGKISILPSYQSGLPGENLSFTVIVTNVGTENDNYTLNVTDTACWNPTLSENLLENVGPGENRVITLSVTIPENATSFAEDNITVTATSAENASVSNSASCVARVQAPPGLVSYWKFDEGSENIAYDNSGYGNQGTIYGATWTVGKIGGALYFDGDDYVLVPSSPSLEITDELTLEAWIRVQYSTDLEILTKRYRFTEVGYGLHFWDPERMVTFHVGATNYGGIGTREIFLELDEWYHIAGTYIENTGEWKIYVNGILENSLTRPGQLAANNAPLRIGGLSPSSFFRGAIDEIRIYNHALSPDEILLHYYLSIMEAHDPIYIEGNDNFTPANGVTSSSGTENDPYIIENWAISAENAHGIWVRNTNVHFIIRNCYIYDGYLGFNKGISFENVRNGKIVNVVSKNNWHGIYLTDSDNNRLKNNTCENNSNYGIALAFSDNNHIHHNNLINNQAYDNGSNYWDNSYPSGGNYWSDYTGVDNYRGENQDIPGSDGIGDIPYYIFGDNNLDRYPLVWTGSAVLRLENMWAICLEKNLDLYRGSKLVAKFYTYSDAFENESAIKSFVPPWHVEEIKNVLHPLGLPVEIVTLVLTTDNTEEVISTIASFIVGKVHLEVRFTEIPLEWALASPAEKVALEIEFSDMPVQWAIAPP